jgi:hypothetical protein
MRQAAAPLARSHAIASSYAARKLKRAQVLRTADSGASDEEIARNVGVSGSAVYRTKRRFVLGDIKAALSEKPRPGADRKRRAAISPL